MYIVPNTVIKVLTGVRICNDYEHTIYFDTAESQRAYFSGLAKFTFNNQTYQRANKNSVRVNKCADDIYDCNYLMFQNTSYGNKWFYAFITSIDYINNETAEINYQIDVMQTWFFEAELKKCMVERNHVKPSDDIPFIWQAPEPFSPNEYVIDYDEFYPIYFPKVFGEDNCPWITLCCNKIEGINQPPDMYCGVYSGLWYLSVPAKEYHKITEFLDGLTNIAGIEAIVSISMCAFPVNKTPYTEEFNCVNIKNTNIGGYVIRNKKLLNYPFTYIKAISTDGDSVILKPDLVFDERVKFKLHCASSMPPVAAITPSYEGINPNYEYTITYSETPECAWSGDIYKSWKAQHLYTNTLNKIAGAGNMAMSAAKGVAGAGAGKTAPMMEGLLGVNSSLGVWAQENDMKTLPGKNCGTPGGGTLNYSTGRLGFDIMRYVCAPNELQLYDKFLDLYGYAINTVFTPKRKARAHWSYVKTRGANIIGNVPADDMKEIKSIYDKGITFWVNGNEVGDYSLDNTVEEVTP